MLIRIFYTQTPTNPREVESLRTRRKYKMIHILLFIYLLIGYTLYFNTFMLRILEKILEKSVRSRSNTHTDRKKLFKSIDYMGITLKPFFIMGGADAKKLLNFSRGGGIYLTRPPGL